MTDSQPLWIPTPERKARSNMHQFMRRIAERHGVDPLWESLRIWSIEHRDAFWAEMLDFAGIRPFTPAREVVRGSTMLDTQWFVGMELNYTAHVLRHESGDAILFANERGQRGRMTFPQLKAAVARFAAALSADGVNVGDRVAGYMPNIPQTVIAMLAAASRGAVWSSCSPDFGTQAVLDRFGQIEPTVLVTADGYTYNGKRFELRDRIAEILPKLPSVRRLVVVPYLEGDRVVGDFSGLAPDVRVAAWDDYLPADAGPLACKPVPFNHPLYILYSSGTTGVPKCIVHGHGGSLLQHCKELLLHTDLKPGEHILYYTTCGWMMWNWLVSGLAAGAAIVLYDGQPAHPDIHTLWKLAGELPIHVFGTSPKYIAACQKAGIRPGAEHDLSALRAVLSTGSPLTVEQFEWVYENIKSDLQLSSISGGTDIVSCFMLGNPVLPVYPGQIQCRGLGMDVHAWNDDGVPVVGQKGELVCTSPFPSQPVCFWNDPDGRKYRGAYFEFYPGKCVWRHGDFIEITETGGVIVYGRSDATLNPGGVRIGTAEIYRLVESLPEVLDSLVVGRRTNGDEEICLFVVLREGLVLDAALVEKIRQTIADGATRRHVPRHIRQIREVPYTISGKKVELAVQQILHGEPVRNREALANPQALDQFEGILD